VVAVVLEITLVVVAQMVQMAVLEVVVAHLVVEVLGTRQLNLRHKEIMAVLVEMPVQIDGVAVAVVAQAARAAMQLL
jgi:hypothetical protein